MVMSISPANDGDDAARDEVAARCRKTLHTEMKHRTQNSIIIHMSNVTYVSDRSIATKTPMKSAAGRRIGPSFRACLTFRQEYPRNVGTGGNSIFAEAAAVQRLRQAQRLQNAAEKFAIKFRNILGRLFIVAGGGREWRKSPGAF
jgi:hypothetical protein